ncbi:hypothetical protein AB0871_18095 [Micromonospora marina]
MARQRAPQQFHLGIEVGDIETDQSGVLALGATLQQDAIGPDGYGWRIYADPVGTRSAAATRVSPRPTRVPSGPGARSAAVRTGNRSKLLCWAGNSIPPPPSAAARRVNMSAMRSPLPFPLPTD